MSLFANKTLLITGGTGSFGNAVLNRFLRTDIGEIRIFSRDEKKQDDMRHEFQAKMPDVADKIKFYIGDVRDLASVKNAMHGVDYIFHAAALKQVPSCEFFPIEAVKTLWHACRSARIGYANRAVANVRRGRCVNALAAAYESLPADDFVAVFNVSFDFKLDCNGLDKVKRSRCRLNNDFVLTKIFYTVRNLEKRNVDNDQDF